MSPEKCGVVDLVEAVAVDAHGVGVQGADLVRHDAGGGHAA
jgi:hypothetical protein